MISGKLPFPGHEGNPIPESEIWGGVTDPAQHNPASFRYVVHGVNTWSKSLSPLAHLDMLSTGTYQEESGTGDQTIDLMAFPERISQRVSISASLIDQAHHATYGSSGLILGIPAENVIMAAPQDLGAANNSLSTLLNRAKSFGHIPDPNTIINATSSTEHNEVVALGATGPRPIEIKGFFYTATPSGLAVDSDITEAFREHSRRLGLPMIRLIDHSLGYTDGLVQYEQTVAVHYRGTRYLMDTGTTSAFNGISESHTYHFASPTELNEVLTYAQTQGLDPATEKTIREAYHQTDRERMRPRVRFAEDGSVLNVTKVDGYGSEEASTTISRFGAQSLSKEAEMRRIRDSFSGNGYIDYQRDQNDLKLVDLAVAARIVDEAVSYLEADQQAAVRTWFEGVKPVIVDSWDFALRMSRPFKPTLPTETFRKMLAQE